MKFSQVIGYIICILLLPLIAVIFAVVFLIKYPQNCKEHNAARAATAANEKKEVDK